MKSMTKRLLSILLVLCMMLSVMPVAAFAEEGAEPVTAPNGTVAGEPKTDESEEKTSEVKTPEDKTSEDKSSEEKTSEIALFKGGHGGGSIGGFDTDEKYYHNSDKFGYDSFTRNGDLTGVKSVTVGGTSLSRGNASSTTGAVAGAGSVRITFEEGYYLTRWKVVCNDKYDCQTDSAGHAAHGDNVMSGASDTGYYDITISQKMMGHRSQKGPYWLLLEVAKDRTMYSVTYNWGDLTGNLANDVPVDSNTYMVNASVTTLAPSDAAIKEAGKLGYEFDGWVKSNDSKVVSGGDKFAMPQANVTLTARWKTATTSFTVTKVWNDNDNQAQKRPDSITVQLLQNREAFKDVTLSAANNWTYTWNDLPKVKDGAAAAYSVAEVSVPAGYTSSVNGGTITNTLSSTVTVKVIKIWDDDNNRDGLRRRVTVNLLANGEFKANSTLGDWSGAYTSFTFDRYDKNGKEIQYTVEEVNIPSGYTSKVDKNVGDDGTITLTITNTHTPEKVTISGQKTWVDNDDEYGSRPESITINLLADGVKVDSKVVTAADGWKWRFEADKNKAGKEITYTITEEPVADYKTEVIGNNVVNTYDPEMVTISGSKTWNDSNNQDGKRPDSITIKVYAGDQYMGQESVTAADNWSWSFDLPRYKFGQEITYRIVEDPVPGYTTTYDGYNVINTHEPETITISGEKHWHNDTELTRPASITVYLNADGEQVDEATVTAGADGKWTYSFANKPKYAGGKEIVYTITEASVPGYDFSAAFGTDGGNKYDIINTYNPGKTSVTVQKTWDDDNNRDGIRPTSVKVQLKNGPLNVGDPVELNERNQWTYTFNDLDATVIGIPILYTVAEVDVPQGYEAKVTGDRTAGFTITNTHIPETTKVSVEKKWDDENDAAGFRPESVEVMLYRVIGEERVLAARVVTLNAENKWKHTWEYLPANENGEKITYTVDEAEVKNYTKAITGDQTKGFTVTNTHNPEKMKVTVTKTWDDGDNQDGLRPNSVKVTLYRNGTEVGKATLDKDNNWSYTFTGMPVYAEGEKAIYTVTEASVENYQADYSHEEGEGELVLKVFNTYTPKMTSIDVTKKWTDNNNKAGVRPKEVTIYLLADGKKTDKELVLSKDGNWTGSFKDLPVNKDGKAIKYTISEKSVSKYKAKITGSAEKGFVVTNTHVSIPTTGDSSNMMMYAVLFTLGAAAVVSALILGRKKNGGYGGKYARRG